MSLSRFALARRCARAEALLHRILEARYGFAMDFGGPPPTHALQVIERWIADYFAGSYYGNVEVVPSDPELAEILRGTVDEGD